MPALVTEIVGMVRRMFDKCLEPKIAEGSNQAILAADASVRRWGSKVSVMWFCSIHHFTLVMSDELFL